MREYPLCEGAFRPQVPAVNNCSHDERIRRLRKDGQFACQLAPRVYVQGTGFVSFAIVSARSVENRIRGDVNHARVDPLRNLSERSAGLDIGAPGLFGMTLAPVQLRKGSGVNNARGVN